MPPTADTEEVISHLLNLHSDLEAGWQNTCSPGIERFSIGSSSFKQQDFNVLMKVRAIATSPTESSSAAKVLSDSRISRVYEDFMNKMYEMEECEEGFYANSITSVEHLRCTFPRYNPYLNQVKEEIGLAMGVIGKVPSHIVFVGSGSLPVSAILAHHTFGSRVTCVDFCDKACDLSSDMLKRMGLSETIAVANCDGNIFDYNGAEVVMLANMIRDMDGVVRQILRSATVKAFICRTAFELRQFGYRNVDLSRVVQMDCKCVAQTEPKRGGFISTGMVYVPTTSCRTP
jgi:hypothetical protein